MITIGDVREQLIEEGIEIRNIGSRYVQLGPDRAKTSTLHDKGNYYEIYATDKDYESIIAIEDIQKDLTILSGTQDELKRQIKPGNNKSAVIGVRNGNIIIYKPSGKYNGNLVCVYNDRYLTQIIRILINNYLESYTGTATDKVPKIKKDLLDQITRSDVIEAIYRWNNDINIDPDFREKKHNSRKFPLRYKDGKTYNSKVIFAIAYEVHYHEHISTDNLTGGDKKSNTVATHLNRLGFEVGDYEKEVKALDSAYSDEEKKEHAESLSMDGLRNIAIKRTAKPKVETRSVSHRARDPYIAEYARRRANGYCQLCKKAAPFLRKDGTPYLESHHIIWLSEGGEDSVENTVALCPNCHRKMHNINDPEDIAALMKAISE